jgi:hypothetical protein
VLEREYRAVVEDNRRLMRFGEISGYRAARNGTVLAWRNSHTGQIDCKDNM